MNPASDGAESSQGSGAVRADSATLELLAAELRDLSARMQEFAESAEWDRVSELERVRLAVLERAAVIAKRHGLIDSYAELLRAALAANDALLAHCSSAREQLGREIRDTGMRRQILNAYGARRAAV